MWMYGKLVQIEKFRMEGCAPDGTCRPDADVECMVSFDPVESGCGSDGFCNPGADVMWYVNGTQVQDTPWTGYDGSLDGYVATYRVKSPQTGSMVVTAKSANTITFNITVSATDTQAGQIAVSSVACLNQENSHDSPVPPCICAGNDLTIYFTSTFKSVGNGMAYYDVLVNGTIVYPNQVDSTTDPIGHHRGSVTIDCPPSNSTITIRGKNDSGDSITIGSTVVIPPGQTFCDDGNTRCVNNSLMSWCTRDGVGSWVDNAAGSCGDDPTPVCTRPCTSDYCDGSGNKYKCYGGCASPNGETCTGGVTPPVDNPSSTDDILARITGFYNDNKIVSIVGIALLGGFMMFGGRK